MDAGWYVPNIVTTLRLYVRRGASRSLLLRIAGGARCWHDLNARWNLDGRAPSPRTPALIEGMPTLSTAERRIALAQIADEFAQAGQAMPQLVDLASHFGVSRHCIAYDLDRLQGTGGASHYEAAE